MRQCLLITAAVLVLSSWPAAAQHFPENPIGADYLAAPPTLRTAFAEAVARRLSPAASDEAVRRRGARIAGCMLEAVTARGETDAAGAVLMRLQPLQDLAALCALLEK